MKQERNRLKSIEDDEKAKEEFREKEEKAWEDVRDSRVNSWRDFTSPSGAKKKQKKVSMKRERWRRKRLVLETEFSQH